MVIVTRTLLIDARACGPGYYEAQNQDFEKEITTILDSRFEGRYNKKSADTSTDTAKCGLQTQKGGRYEGRYAKYRDFQYLALSGEYLRICSCIFHWFSAMKPLDDKQHCNIKAIPFFVCVSGLK